MNGVKQFCWIQSYIFEDGIQNPSSIVRRVNGFLAETIKSSTHHKKPQEVFDLWIMSPKTHIRSFEEPQVNRWIYMIYPYSFNRSLWVLNRNLETTPFFVFAGFNLCSTHLPVKVTTKMTIFCSSEAPTKSFLVMGWRKSRSVLFCIFGWGPSVHLVDRLVHSHHLSFDRTQCIQGAHGDH